MKPNRLIRMVLRSSLPLVILGFITPLHCHGQAITVQPSTAGSISLKLPDRDHLFRLESEAALREKILSTNPTARFPKSADIPPVVDTDHFARPPLRCIYPANVICYRNLYFEDPKTERDLIGHTLLEPVRSTALFYSRVLILPAKAATNPPWRWQCHWYP